MTAMKKNIFKIVLATLILTFALPATAQQPDELREDLREFSHQYLSRALKLERSQETPFFNAYDQMQNELYDIGEDTRKLETKIDKDTNATDLELETTARAIFEQKRKEADVELRYFEQFKTLLTPRQLVKLKPAMRDMTRALIKYHRDQRHGQSH